MNTRPTVLLLPGMLCDAAVWQHQIAALAPFVDLQVPVFRGFRSFAAMADHVLALAPARFSLVSHSMGGRVAIELLRRTPERIAQFVIMDAGVHPVAAGEYERNRQLLSLAASGGLAAVADQWIPFMLHPQRHADAALCERIRRMVLRNSVEDLRGQLEAAEQRPDQTAYLASIQHTVRIVCGEQDNWNPLPLQQQLKAALAAAELVVIPDCGHMAPMEAPERVNQLLLDWLV